MNKFKKLIVAALLIPTFANSADIDIGTNAGAASTGTSNVFIGDGVAAAIPSATSSATVIGDHGFGGNCATFGSPSYGCYVSDYAVMSGAYTSVSTGSIYATLSGAFASIGGFDSVSNDLTLPARYATVSGAFAHGGADFVTEIGALGNVTGLGGTGVGYNVSVTGSGSAAFGVGATSSGSNSVVLGNSSNDNGVSNVVSVGDLAVGIKRKIVAVANGTVAAGSSEAVTGDQLFTVNQKATTAINTANSAQTTANNAQTTANNALTSANAYTDSVFANVQSGGAPQDLTPLLARDGSRAMTGNLQMGNNKITGLKDGTLATDASTVSQMQAGDAQTLVASINYANSLVSQSDGVTSSSLTVNPGDASLTVTNSLGNTHGILVDTTHTVISGGTTSTSLTLDDSGATLATVATGGPAQLHGVAPGTSGTDAVNLNQLNSAITSFGGGGNPADIKRLDGRIDNLSAELKKVAKRAYGGAALAMATAAATPVQAGETQVSFGIGNFNGESALAVSVYKATESGNAVVGFGGGITSSGDIGFRGTITFAWNPTLADNSESK